MAEQGLAQGCPDLTYAVKLLPLVVWGGSDQVLEFLADYRGLASEAASSAVAAGDVTLAVRVLEQGRAVVWQQDLANRTPREELLRQLVAQGPRPHEETDNASRSKTHTKAGRNRSGGAADRQAPSLPSDLVERMDRTYAALACRSGGRTGLRLVASLRAGREAGESKALGRCPRRRRGEESAACCPGLSWWEWTAPPLRWPPWRRQRKRPG